MNNSPLISAAAIASIVGAVIALLVSFGVQLTADQTAANGAGHDSDGG